MTNTKQREVEVFSTYDSIDETALANKRKEIAEKYNVSPDEIKFEIETEDDYGTIGAIINAVFRTPKTKEELGKEKRQAELQLELERDQYERLQEKFGKE